MEAFALSEEALAALMRRQQEEAAKAKAATQRRVPAPVNQNAAASAASSGFADGWEAFALTEAAKAKVDKNAATSTPPVPLTMRRISSSRLEGQYCCILGWVDAAGDGCGFPPCCYLAFCGPVIGSKHGPSVPQDWRGHAVGVGDPKLYACCCGCDLRGVMRCQRPIRPLCELPCPIICCLWPLIWPTGFCLSHVCHACGCDAVYAGGFCDCCEQDCERCAGPTHDHDYWYEEHAMCSFFACNGKTWPC